MDLLVSLLTGPPGGGSLSILLTAPGLNRYPPGPVRWSSELRAGDRICVLGRGTMLLLRSSLPALEPVSPTRVQRGLVPRGAQRLCTDLALFKLKEKAHSRVGFEHTIFGTKEERATTTKLQGG